MENFFNFIDKINKPLFILYDKSFIHLNKYLLNSLGFTPQNRPGSLTQIMESKWITRLSALKVDEEIDIPLIMNGGKVKKYTVRLHTLGIENSEYSCFILNVKEVIDQNIDLANRIFSKIPFPSFLFTKDFEIINVNTALENLESITVNTFDDIKEIFKIEEFPEISNNEHLSFVSRKNDFALNIFMPLPAVSYNFFAGVITEISKSNSNIDMEVMKRSISQSIKSLIKVQELYGNQAEIAQPIWEGIHNEITNLGQLKRQLENEVSTKTHTEEVSFDLNNIIINEIEILKSNNIFREKVKLITQFTENLKPLNKKYAKISDHLKTLMSQIVQLTTQTNENELYIETIYEDGLIWLKIFANKVKEPLDGKTKILDNLKHFEKQFTEVEAKFSYNINSKNNIDLNLGFEK